MKRKPAPPYQAIVCYQSRAVGHVDRKLRKLAREWGGTKSDAGYNKMFDLRRISFTFPTTMKRYRFIQKVRTYLKEIEYELCGVVQFR